jgi:hypothetical protein
MLVVVCPICDKEFPLNDGDTDDCVTAVPRHNHTNKPCTGTDKQGFVVLQTERPPRRD